MLGALSVPRLRLLLVDTKRSLSDWSYPDCAAPYWRIYWNEKGRGIVGHEGRALFLQGRTVLLIPPETHFSAEAISPMDHLYIHFLAGAPYDRPKPSILRWKAEGIELEELSRLAAASDSEGGAGERADAGAASDLRGAALLAHSLCCRMLARFPPESLSAPGGGSDFAHRVEELVLSRLAETPSNEELARELGASVPTVERRIRLETGRALHAYVPRAQSARGLLPPPPFGGIRRGDRRGPRLRGPLPLLPRLRELPRDVARRVPLVSGLIGSAASAGDPPEGQLQPVGPRRQPVALQGIGAAGGRPDAALRDIDRQEELGPARELEGMARLP